MASILVLDDRAVERELLEVVLDSAGHTVLQASTGEDALALARAEHPELVIADVLMPGMDGYEFVRALRADAATASTRVILCTATYDEDEVRRLALACGVAHIMIKPVEPHEMMRVVEAALSAEQRLPELESAETFERGQLRAANAKLIEKVAELERADEVRRLLAAIVESSNDAIVAETLDGTIVSWNHGAEQLYGYSAGEAVGRAVAMLIPAELSEEEPAIVERIERGELAHRLETVRVRKDGSAIDVAVTVSPVYGEDGGLTGAATIAHDISLRKRAERELELAHRTAVETARAKTEFVTNMSHQIRTPLNGIVGMTRLLADTTLDRRQQEYMDALEASNNALLLVVNDVLDFAKLEAGRMQLDRSSFDCRGAVEEAMLMLAPSARAKSLQLSHQVEDDVPVAVLGDCTRLRQVLLNLLSNAIKFTAAGEVLLHVSTAGEGTLRFAVSDTGVGIPDGPSDSLFEAFAQADQSTARRYGGTGLGLAICRELVARMGGQTGAESRDGGGATFWFTAELPSATATAIRPIGHTSVGAAPDGPLVLLAEDDAINRTVAEAFLRKQGLRAEIALEGRQAVEMAGTRSYAAILMDCQMPELDGYEATRRIREVEQGQHTPIIAMTAHAMPGDRERCLEAGMDDYITKPVRAETLERVLERWFHAEPAVPSGSVAASTIAGDDGFGLDEDVFDQAVISELKDTLPSEMRRVLLEKFEQSLSKNLEDIASAARSRDRIELRRLAHLLKGSSASLGASRLSRGFLALEQLSGERDKPVGQEQLDELKATASATGPALRRRLL
jgi:PAS domain S-box-containing protein